MEIQNRTKSFAKGLIPFSRKVRKEASSHGAGARQTALVYCEKQFGLVDGKTAAALVRHSEIYQIVGVIDSSLTGKDAAEE